MGRTRMSPLAIRRHEDLESQDFEAIPMYIPSRKGNVALTLRCLVTTYKEE
jgi:hypothetical protein